MCGFFAIASHQHHPHDQLLGVVATNALELGVDIGSLDAVVMLGYPGSSASLWQQVGRAGRGTRPAAAIMVAYNSPVDQFFASHPNALLQRPPEVHCSTHLAPFCVAEDHSHCVVVGVQAAAVNLQNERIVQEHVLCAAAEAPIGAWDAAVLGPSTGTAIKALLADMLLLPAAVGATKLPPAPRGKLGYGGGGAAAAAGRQQEEQAWRASTRGGPPSRKVSLRSIGDQFRVLDAGRGGELLDEIEARWAFFRLYEGAIYLNQGRQYQVVRLDIEGRQAYVRASKAKYYTKQRDLTNVNMLSRMKTQSDGCTHLGKVQVRMQANSELMTCVCVLSCSLCCYCCCTGGDACVWLPKDLVWLQQGV